MGQEAGKSAWPKANGGYQTITGRRYGRRHAYISFRPTKTKHRNAGRVDPQETEMGSIQKERSIAPKGRLSSMLHAILPVSNSVHPEMKAKAGKDAPVKKPWSSRRPPDTPSSIHTKKLKADPTEDTDLETNGSLKKSSEASAWPIAEDEDLSNAGALSFVNIDSYEPDSSGGEEENPGADPSHGLQRRLDDMIFELGKEFDYLSGLHSYLYTKSSCEGTDSQPKDSPEKDSIRDSNPEEFPPLRSLSSEQPDSNQTLEGSKTPAAPAAGVSHGAQEERDQPETQAEMVVRPKIRKQTSETQLEQQRKSSSGEAAAAATTVPVTVALHGGSSTTVKPASKTKCVSAPPFFLTQTERPNPEFLFNFPQVERRRRRWREEADGGCELDSDDEDDIWEELEDFNEKCAPFIKAEESSECSEGEWSASWTSDSGLEKERRSSEESWETLPGLDDQSSPGGSSLEDVPELSHSPQEAQPPLEEGEVPWLMYNGEEETGSSSDEEEDPEAMSHFVHPGLFILDGNNNLEDDSSMSEDLDAEWRLLDDFGEGFGMAQAISYVDPQLLTYMALEERLAQAMEAALAHLESLAIDVEQAHPPATEQIIQCLPQITMQEDSCGQEQCCAICCCEYVKDEIATQLPCQHMFHKICVTLWLQKSGTCPVCRYVLTPALPEPPAPTSFVSDQDIPPSNHSAAGTR
ncbi:E3 ubiquitin-protein ligase Praja-2 [Aplochiton taeniatus]